MKNLKQQTELVIQGVDEYILENYGPGWQQLSRDTRFRVAMGVASCDMMPTFGECPADLFYAVYRHFAKAA